MNTKRIKAHILQHVPFESAGSIGVFLKEHQARVTYTRFFEDSVLPEMSDLELLVILGGPMSVNDENVLPWLRDEKEFIREAAARQIPMIGICLGAQLIASALGARVYVNHRKEIGWFDVMAMPYQGNCFRFPKQFLAFHWHGETFDLPPGATLLARSDACENQAFQVGRHIIGLQFHLETTLESVKVLAAKCRNELVPGPCIQPEPDLLQVPMVAYEKINRIMNEILIYLLGIEH